MGESNFFKTIFFFGATILISSPYLTKQFGTGIEDPIVAAIQPSKEEEEAGLLCDCKLKGIDPATHTTCKSATEGSTPEEFDKIDVLIRHNEYRNRVMPQALDMVDLTWDEKLACMAQKWTSQCTDGQDGSASIPDPVGQNVVAGPLGAFDILLACHYWGAPGVNYTYSARGVPRGNILYYTQIIWANTKKVGCGATRCPNTEKTYYACFYSPPGNVWSEDNLSPKPYKTAFFSSHG